MQAVLHPAQPARIVVVRQRHHHLADHLLGGGGEAVAAALTRVTGATVPLLGQVPIDVRLREGGDKGVPLVLTDPDSAAAKQLTEIAATLANRSRGLAGRRLGLTPV